MSSRYRSAMGRQLTALSLIATVGLWQTACKQLLPTTGPSRESRVNGDYYANVQIAAGGRSFILETADGKPLPNLVVQVGLHSYRTLGGHLDLPASALAELKQDSRGFFRVFAPGYAPQQVWIGSKDDHVSLAPVHVLATEMFKPGVPLVLSQPSQGLQVTVPPQLVSAAAPVSASVYATKGGQAIDSSAIRAKVQKLLAQTAKSFRLTQAASNQDGSDAGSGDDCPQAEQPFPCTTLPQGIGLLLSIDAPLQAGTIAVTYDLNAWLNGWDGVSPPPWAGSGAASWTADAILEANSAARVLKTFANMHALGPSDEAAYRQVLASDYGVTLDDATKKLTLTVPIDTSQPTALDGYVRTDIDGVTLLGVSMEVTVVSPAAGQLPPALVAPGQIVAATPMAVGPLVAGNGGNVIGNNGGSLISNNGGALDGTVNGPDPVQLLSGNTGNLTANTEVKFGLLSYTQYPWAGVLVTLVDTSGKSIGIPTVADANAHYTLASLPDSGAVLFVEARSANENLLTAVAAPGSAAVTADINPATTVAASYFIDEVNKGQTTLSNFNSKGFTQDVAQLVTLLNQTRAIAAAQGSTTTDATIARNVYTTASYQPQAAPPPPSNKGTPPVVSSLSASSAARGSSLTIRGSGFSSSPASDLVTFGGVAATVNSAAATQLVVTVPAGAKGAATVVVEASGLQSLGTPFSVLGPEIDSQDISYGDSDDLPLKTVRLTGTGFGSGPSVKVGGAQATVLTSSETSLAFKVPLGGNGQIIVSVSGQTSNPGNFTDTGAGGVSGSGCPPAPYACP